MPCKRELADGEERQDGPKLLEGLNGSKVYFKQDDKFDQPYVYAKFMMYCSDLDFSESKEADMFASLWQFMLEEEFRELQYTGLVASISFSQSKFPYAVGFNFRAFNQNFVAFFAEAFSEVQHFSPSEGFFNDKKK